MFEVKKNWLATWQENNFTMLKKSRAVVKRLKKDVQRDVDNTLIALFKNYYLKTKQIYPPDEIYLDIQKTLSAKSIDRTG